MWRELLKPFSRTKISPAPETLQIGDQTLPLLVVRNPRARRYLLRLRPDGAARVTIPRGGSQAQALAFVDKHRGWLQQQLQRQQSQPRLPVAWNVGSEIWFRGAQVKIESPSPGKITFGLETLAVKDMAADLRPALERHLRRLAAQELPPRVGALAALHGLLVARVTVRNQRSRWGSCSRRGTISLNWRLIQAPEFVRDYIIIHELAHLRHMNHADRFWAEVERLCPDYRAAERWLKTHRIL